MILSVQTNFHTDTQKCSKTVTIPDGNKNQTD